MNCPACGSSLREEARMCLECGEVVRARLSASARLVPAAVAGVPGWIALDGAEPEPIQIGAGRVPRFFAYALDSIILGILVVPLYLAISGQSLDIRLSQNGTYSVDWLAWAVVWAIQAVYWVVLTASSLQGTLGKKMAGLRVVSGTSFDRITLPQSITRFAVQLVFLGVALPLACLVVPLAPIPIAIALVIIVGGGSSPWDAVAGTRVIE